MKALLDRVSTYIRPNLEIEVNTMEDLQKLTEEYKCNDLIIRFPDSDSKSKNLYIIIYDDYIE